MKRELTVGLGADRSRAIRRDSLFFDLRDEVQMLSDLQPAPVEAVERGLSAGLDDLYSCKPALDIRANQQSTLYSRLFQS